MIVIDIMTVDDLPQVMKIEKESFTNPWSVNAFLHDIKDNTYALYLTANSGKKLVGYIGGWIILDELHITNLAVDKEFRKQGIAEKLLKNIFRLTRLQQVNRVTLEVRVSNLPAINLYKKIGFEPEGCRPGYYSDNNEDALIMWKELNNG